MHLGEDMTLGKAVSFSGQCLVRGPVVSQHPDSTFSSWRMGHHPPEGFRAGHHSFHSVWFLMLTIIKRFELKSQQ